MSKPVQSEAERLALTFPVLIFLIRKILQQGLKELRHTGMDRRYPDCMDAPKPRHPWNLGSGDPCRNDGFSDLADTSF